MKYYNINDVYGEIHQIELSETNNCGRDNLDMTLYIIRCWNNFENFYKIGVTREKYVKNRFNHSTKMPYSYEIIKTISGKQRNILDLEKSLHSIANHRHYTPKLKFGGYKTECLSKMVFVIGSLPDLIDIRHLSLSTQKKPDKHRYIECRAGYENEQTQEEYLEMRAQYHASPAYLKKLINNNNQNKSV